MPSITVKHNFEAAHRLSLLPGKCESIHGHSFWATLTIYGEVNEQGILEGLDFGNVKKEFRKYLDSEFDHHLLLNRNDPFAGNIHLQNTEGWQTLPGLNAMDGDPTTENLALLIANYMGPLYNLSTEVKVDETSVNAASCWWLPEGEE